MAQITMRGTPATTVGDLPEVGSRLPETAPLTAVDLSDVTLDRYAGRRLVLNIFPSIDTGVCSTSVRRFNDIAAGLDNTTVICVSNDLPFALGRFCGAEGIANVATLSGFRSDFGDVMGVTFADGRMRGLLSRAVVVVDTDGTVIHTEQVSDTSHEPDYDAAVAAL